MKVKVYSDWKDICSKNIKSWHEYVENPFMETVRKMEKFGFNVVPDRYFYEDGTPMQYHIYKPCILECHDIAKFIIELITTFECKVAVDYKNDEFIMVLLFGDDEYDYNEEYKEYFPLDEKK
jgi:hypothetical protein